MFSSLTDPPYWIRTWPRSLQVGTPAHHLADPLAGVLGVLGGGRLARADGPHRLVGDDHARPPSRRAARRGRPRPGPASRSLVMPVSRSSMVSPTQQIGVMPLRSTALQLGGHHLVGLAEQPAPFGVADDDVLDVELGQHQRAHLAGEGARVLDGAVLGTEGDRDPVRLDDRLHGADVGERADGRRCRRGPASDGWSRRPRSRAACRASRWSRFIFQLPLISGRRRRVPVTAPAGPPRDGA